jgi:hypothetical protein
MTGPKDAEIPSIGTAEMDVAAAARYEIVVRRGSPLAVRFTRHAAEEIRRRILCGREADIPDALGVSRDTWNRVQAGGLVRRSTADRLLKRADRLALQ